MRDRHCEAAKPPKQSRGRRRTGWAGGVPCCRAVSGLLRPRFARARNDGGQLSLALAMTGNEGPSLRGGEAAEAIQGAAPHGMGGRRTVLPRRFWIASRSLALALAMTGKQGSLALAMTGAGDTWAASPSAPARDRHGGSAAATSALAALLAARGLGAAGARTSGRGPGRRQPQHRLAGDGVGDAETLAEVLAERVEDGDHLRARLGEPFEARPFADEAEGALAGADERAAAEALEGEPRLAMRRDEMLLASRLDAKPYHVECGHVALPCMTAEAAPISRAAQDRRPCLIVSRTSSSRRRPRPRGLPASSPSIPAGARDGRRGTMPRSRARVL